MKDISILSMDQQAEIYKIKYSVAETRLERADKTIKKLEDIIQELENRIHDLEVNGLENLPSQEKLRIYEKRFHSVQWHNDSSKKYK